MAPLYRARAFGLLWRSDVALGGFDPAPDDAAATGPWVDVGRVDHLPGRYGGRPVNRGFVYPDGIRFVWGREVAFDMIGGTRIAYAPGPDWTGAMPASFYSTLAALTVAWRGMVPLHASTVALDGRAVLIAGRAGAGKSTLAAGLVAAGAAFVADDLTVAMVGVDGRIAVTRGRPTIRLHPDSAARLDTIRAHPIAGDERGKWLAQPRLRLGADRLDLGAILLLGDGGPVDNLPAARLPKHIFRPGWLRALPMYGGVMRDVLRIAAAVPVTAYPALDDIGANAMMRRAEDVIAAVRASSRVNATGATRTSS